MARRVVEDFGDDHLRHGPVMSILPELQAGETLIWTGCPRSARRLMMWTVPKAFFGLAFLAFTVLWMAMVVRGGHNNWDQGRAVGPFEPHNVGIATLVGLWMIPPGLYVLTWPIRTWRRLKSTCYALTDRRAIISEPGLLGRPRVRSYTAHSLRLMRSEEHDDGTGDLIFESPSNWVGMAETVGFLAIEDTRDVEAIVRRTLFPPARPRWESSEQAARPAPAILGRKSYRLSLSIRLFQFVFLAAGLLTALCIIGNLGLFVGRADLPPKLICSAINPPGAAGAVGPHRRRGGDLLIAAWSPGTLSTSPWRSRSRSRSTRTGPSVFAAGCGSSRFRPATSRPSRPGPGTTSTGSRRWSGTRAGS